MAKKLNYSFYRPHARVQYTGELVNHKTGEMFTPPARTKQQFVEQCDINTIVNQHKKAGTFEQLMAVRLANEVKVLPDALDFQESLNTVIQAEQVFAALPSKIRNRFSNEPREYLAFMENPENQDEAIRLGLATDKRPPTEPKVAPAGPNGGDGGKPPSEGAKAP